MNDWVVMVHGAATWWMVGLIWFVQRVHYPLMARCERASFGEFEREHQARTTPIVAVPMVVEAVSGAVVLARTVGTAAFVWWAGSMALLAGAWVSTALVQVPCHRALERGFDERTHRRLVASNWARTVAWTARGVIVAVLLPRGVPGVGDAAS